MAKNWCYTLNNPTLVDENKITTLYASTENITYHCYQTESGDNGTRHIQGFIQLEKKKAMHLTKRYFENDTVHLEVARGTSLQASEYCKKPESRVEGPSGEEGQLKGGKGKRTDIDAFVESMKENIKSDEQLLEQFPSILAHYPRFVKTTRDILEEAHVQIPPLVPNPGWQTALCTSLGGPADARQVTWFCDPIGGTGKSTFARRYRTESGQRSFICTGGKHADIYYAYRREPVVFFDLARTAQEKVPYEVMENFKNGGFLSTKYESKWVTFNVPHVICFANYLPDETKLSLDRWNIIEI